MKAQLKINGEPIAIVNDDPIDMDKCNVQSEGFANVIKQEEFNNYLFKNTIVPRNRREIRAMLQDRKRFEPLLKALGDTIEQSINKVNEAEDHEKEYFYTMGLDLFNHICDLIEQVKRPKYWKLNRHFYTETVKPVV